MRLSTVDGRYTSLSTPLIETRRSPPQLAGFKRDSVDSGRPGTGVVNVLDFVDFDDSGRHQTRRHRHLHRRQRIRRQRQQRRISERDSPRPWPPGGSKRAGTGLTLWTDYQKVSRSVGTGTQAGFGAARRTSRTPWQGGPRPGLVKRHDYPGAFPPPPDKGEWSS